jgi:hypothetical protein
MDTFFMNSSFDEFKNKLEEDTSFLDFIRNNKHLLNHINSTNFREKLLYLLDKDINPFDLYLVHRTYDIKDYFDVIIHYCKERNKLQQLCNFINGIKPVNNLSFWSTLQNVKYIHMVYNHDPDLHLLTNCCLVIFEKNKKKFKFDGMAKFM